MGLAKPPSGIAFVDDGSGHAVLSVGAWTVDHDVAVTGDKSLVVVAAGMVTVDHVVDGAASHEVGGPGAVIMLHLLSSYVLLQLYSADRV